MNEAAATLPGVGYRHQRDDMLAAAVTVARRDGLAALTFGRVAKELDTNDRTVVYYFPTKAELVGAVILTLGGQLQQTLADAFGDGPLPPVELLDRAWPALADADSVFGLFFQIVGLAAAGCGVAFWRWARTLPGQRWIDKTLLRLPIAGPLFLKVAVSRFCRLFGVLFSAGVPATTALATVGQGVGNLIVTDDVKLLRSRIVQGESVMPRPDSAVMPELVYQMMAIGFESGDVDRMLNETARHFEQEVDYDVRRLNDRIQPVLLALLAVGVLMLALAVLLPMWNLISLFKQ